jgi:hypothetical protein
MEMTLVKSLHNGDPDVYKNADLQGPDIQDPSDTSANRVKAV